jgi:nitroimidazol reductase NimA-like FMN-containing flavoprotein (pyridoxamine 5'-phosphate oxidase superfamily)
MKPELRALILRLLGEHRIMTIATNRPDGWPQATVVGYANDGFKLYCFIARLSQKYLNIMRDPRVSIAIAGDFSNPLEIQGLSLAGRAALVEDKTEFERAGARMLERYPEYATWPRPNPALAPMIRITPEIISVLDYSKGFGHSDLVAVSENDLKLHIDSTHHDWRGRAGA